MSSYSSSSLQYNPWQIEGKKTSYFIHLKAKQSTEENNWVVTVWVVTLRGFFVLHTCVTPSTKRFSSIIFHPDYKTSQHKKVTSNFWVPKWHIIMAPLIPLIHTGLKLRGWQWSAPFLLSRVVEFIKKGFWNNAATSCRVNQRYMSMCQDKKWWKIKKLILVNPHFDLLRWYCVLKVLVSFPMAWRVISSSFRFLIQRYLTLVSRASVFLHCSEELNITLSLGLT